MTEQTLVPRVTGTCDPVDDEPWNVGISNDMLNSPQTPNFCDHLSVYLGAVKEEK